MLVKRSGLHALDVPVHLQHVGVRYGQAGADTLGAVGVDDRAGERVAHPGDDLGLDRVGGGGNVGRDRGPIGRNADDTLLEPIPDVLRLPAAVEDGLGALDVVGPPIVDYRRQLALGREGALVGRLAEAELAAFLRLLQRGGAVGALADDVGTLVHQRLRRVAFLARVVPEIAPHHLGLKAWVYLLRGEREGVDAHYHLGDRERADIAH